MLLITKAIAKELKKESSILKSNGTITSHTSQTITTVITTHTINTDPGTTTTDTIRIMSLIKGMVSTNRLLAGLQELLELSCLWLGFTNTRSFKNKRLKEKRCGKEVIRTNIELYRGKALIRKNAKILQFLSRDDQ
jgi:hypothetical protein